MRYLICVVEFGWVLVGAVEDYTEESLVFSRAAVIRYWGTTRGLGELVHGPLPETKWDPISARVRIPAAKIVYTVEAGNGWAGLEKSEESLKATPKETRRGR